MPKDEAVYPGHMVDMAEKVIAKTRDCTREQFDANEDLRLALVHLIQVIGEAARRVPDATRQHLTEIPWRAIIGMRNKVVHDYMDIDEDVVWLTVTEDVPAILPV